MISEKMKSLAANNSAIRAMFEEGNRLAALYGRENVYDFSLGNPNFPAPKEVNEAAIDILQNIDSVYLHGYMSNAGYPEARKSIADSLNRRFDTSFTEHNIIMTVGAAGSLNVALKTILNPGDEVIAIAPYFVEYRNYVANYDGVLHVVNSDSETFQIDHNAVKQAISKKTKVIIINSPNNPTGVIYSEDSIKALADVLEAAQAKYGNDIYIISDEPYRELVYDDTPVPYITKYYSNSFVCYSWSKSLSLPGERIGYLVIPSEISDFETTFAAASIANRVSGCVNAPSLFQLVAARCVDIPTDVSGYDENRRLLYNGLTALGFDCVFPAGAFYLWMKTPGDESEFIENAKKYNLLLVPGKSFAYPGYVRIAYCVAKDTITRSMQAFSKLAADYGLNKQ